MMQAARGRSLSPVAPANNHSIPCATDLSALHAELARMAAALAVLEERSLGAPAGPPEVKLRSILRWRRDRERFFPADLFADPAWDILLDLMSARMKGKKVSVSSLCIGANVPATTALRWINMMIEQGLLVRKPHESDRRRAWVELSPSAAERMTAYLNAV